MRNISARYKNCAQQVIVQDPKLCAVNIGMRHKILARQRSDTQWFLSARSTIYLVLFLHMVNMGVQVEICAREVIRRENNNKKPTIFCDVLYHLNVIFLQRVFEALKSVLGTRKPQEQSVPRNTMSL
jgi:hypothetical protein